MKSQKELIDLGLTAYRGRLGEWPNAREAALIAAIAAMLAAASDGAPGTDEPDDEG